MKNLIKRTLKLWIFTVSAAILWSMPSTNNIYAAPVENNVPDYYYANYEFASDYDAILDWFSKAKAKYSVNQEFDTSEFVKLSKYFDKTFPHLKSEFAETYERCSYLAHSLAENYSYSNMQALMWNSCYKSLYQAITKINSSYTVRPSVSINPSSWMAPLTVTFDARGSSDPSMETIPADNFYRYYRDENWVDTPIGEWQTLSYTFEEAGRFVVHLVVRSSNVDEWILDWEKNMIVNATPKAADIVVYANTRRMEKNELLKIWTTEAEKWIIFDWSLTVPREGREILKYRWTITNNWNTVYDSKTKDWVPGYIQVPLKWNWLFRVTLITKDNQNDTVSETYSLYLSDPVAIMKQSPSNWTTSTTFNFDGSASYSITNRLNSYLWEVFDANGEVDNWTRIHMSQWKKMSINLWEKQKRPWNYMVRLTVTDVAWNQNIETKNIYIESTRPSPQFTATPTRKWTHPSEFTFDASNTIDIDVDNKVDSLEYKRTFVPENGAKIIEADNKNEKVVVQFNERTRFIVRLTVTDQYWKSASVSKYVTIKSILRPEIEAIPWAITRWKTMQFKSSINEPVLDYSWDFGDGKPAINSEFLTDAEHIYWKKWIYSVNLTVRDKNDDVNTVTERVFIWEIDYPIAAFKVKDNKWYFIHPTDLCRIEDESWMYDTKEAYSVDRGAQFTINPWLSVNTKWTSNWLQYAFEKEPMAWASQVKIVSQLTDKFIDIGCHYVDLTVNDTNIWKPDKVRIWFNVKNALPTIKSVSLSFPQYTNNSNTIWFTTDTNSNKSIFDCTSTSNLTIKVTAVNAQDSDWNVSRLRFYYYNIDDPSRILEYKESWISAPYVYFVIPRISWEYKFWVMVYDNDGWMIDSDEFLASNPSVYFPAACGDADVPTVTLKVSNTNIQVWDTVTYSVVSKISSENEDFQTDRTFYYDFTWDWTWDLVTKKDTATYTFNEAYLDWVVPRAAVEYRWKLWQADWATILVKNWVKPILLHNSIGNTVIFRDLSVWLIQEREICFEKSECEAWNKKFKKNQIATIDPDKITLWTETEITKKDTFLRQYDDVWNHDVYIYLKSRYWIEVQTWFKVKTSLDKNNWKIAPGVNMITIPETTFNNITPEIFLSKAMNNTLVMYINNDSWETCYVDTDISRDGTDWDGKTDNDIDITCNKMAKIKYESNFDKAIWRVYFTNNWKLTFKNFYVTFEWYILELDDEKLKIYNDITTLINWIEDLSLENTDLKKSLDRLRKNLNNTMEVKSLIITINSQIAEWWIKIDLHQKELLDSILDSLWDEDTIVTVWKNDYEKNRDEILAILPIEKSFNIKKEIEVSFDEFEENMYSYTPEEKAKELEKIWDHIISDGKNNKWGYNDNDFTPYFCNIFDYYEIFMYTSKCWSSTDVLISQNFDKTQTTEQESWTSNSKWGFPTRLKIVLIILVWWLLTMWWIIIFFSIKAKLNSNSEDEEE